MSHQIDLLQKSDVEFFDAPISFSANPATNDYLSFDTARFNSASVVNNTGSLTLIQGSYLINAVVAVDMSGNLSNYIEYQLEVDSVLKGNVSSTVQTSKMGIDAASFAFSTASSVTLKIKLTTVGGSISNAPDYSFIYIKRVDL